MPEIIDAFTYTQLRRWFFAMLGRGSPGRTSTRRQGKPMTTELILLCWTLVLALVHILIAASFRTQETGLSWNMSARDTEGPPMRPVTSRLKRAQSNLFETLPLFAAAVLIAHVGGREGAMTVLGCQLYLGARVLYLPLYAAGVPMLRSLAWGASLAGLIMVIAAILK
jgi:uncharacterized MAPEG superfamily protein